MQKISIKMVWLGMFLLAMGAGTSDSNSNRYSLLLGAALGFAGLLFMFFAFEENRNVNRLRRMALQLKGYLKR
jgi:hypothetical protein